MVNRCAVILEEILNKSDEQSELPILSFMRKRTILGNAES